MNRTAIRAVEHLKGWVSEVIDKYHNTDVNPAQVKLLIWNELESTIFELKPKHFKNVLWLRVAVKEDEPKILFDCINKEILSSRYLGPREEGDSGVFYITVLVLNIKDAVETVDSLIKEGYNVRDWSYGANRR